MKTCLSSFFDTSSTCKYAVTSLLDSFEEVAHFKVFIFNLPKITVSPTGTLIDEVLAVILSSAFKFT